MSRIPETDKAKYNNDNKFAWVDSQWEKLLTEQRELKDKITNLESQIEELKQDFAYDIRNKQLEIVSLKNQLNLFEDK